MNERPLPKKKMYDRPEYDILVERKNEKIRKKSSMEMKLRRLKIKDTTEKDLRRIRGEPESKKVELGVHI